MPSVQELLDRAKKHLEPTLSYIEDFNQHWLNLPWAYRTCQVLVPDGFVWGDIQIHLYPLTENNQQITRYQADTDDADFIYHGHGRNSVCYAKHQCHVEGYRPTGNEGRNFLERWKRFGYCY